MTARERELQALSRRLAKGIVADLVRGTPRADSEAGVVRALRNRAGIVRRGLPRQPSQEEITFLAVCMTRDELAEIKARAAAEGTTLYRFARERMGLPAVRRRSGR